MSGKESVEDKIMRKLDDAEEREAERQFFNRARKGSVKVDMLNGEGLERRRPWWALLRRSWPRPKRRGW